MSLAGFVQILAGLILIYLLWPWLTLFGCHHLSLVAGFSGISMWGQGRAWFKVAGLFSFISSFLIPRRTKNSFSPSAVGVSCSLHFIALYKFRADYLT